MAQLQPIFRPRRYRVKRHSWAQLTQLGPIFRPRLYGVKRPSWAQLAHWIVAISNHPMQRRHMYVDYLKSQYNWKLAGKLCRLCVHPRIRHFSISLKNIPWTPWRTLHTSILKSADGPQFKGLVFSSVVASRPVHRVHEVPQQIQRLKRHDEIRIRFIRFCDASRVCQELKTSFRWFLWVGLTL